MVKLQLRRPISRGVVQALCPRGEQRGTPNGRDAADVLIAALTAHPDGILWFEPESSPKHQDAHRVTMEQHHQVIASAVLGGGLGDATLARFALLCELDLLNRSTQTGRCLVHSEDKGFELLFTMRPTPSGIRGEVRLLGEELGRSSTIGGEPLPEILPEGTVIGSYRVEGVLGHGGMGIVYYVQHTALRKRCAMKVLRTEVLESDLDSARRFMGEARAAARIQDPHIVNVTDFGALSDGRPFLVMELIYGDPLSEIMRRGALVPRRALELVRGVANALHAAHSRGVIHRDLTPSNIFVAQLDDKEIIKLVDFGACRVCDEEDTPDESSGVVFGTPYYMAPEQARGFATDERSDLYSLGIILYELLTGDVPFDGETVRSILRQHVLDEPSTPRSPHEPLSEEFERIVAQCLRKHPEERFQSASELADDLSRVLDRSGRKGWRKWLPV